MWVRFTIAIMLLLSSAEAEAVDGLALVTSGSWFQPGDLILVDTGSGETSTLVSGGGVFGPCFSPDGSSVAYWRDGQIFTMGVDGSAPSYVADTYNTGFHKQALSWTEDDHIYWSENSAHIYRVSLLDGQRELVFATDNREIQLLGVARDGLRAAASKPNGWHVWVYDLAALEERDLNTGCQGTVSPNGVLVTRNGYFHRSATAERFDDLTVFSSFDKPLERGEFQMHRFSHRSNMHVLFTADVDHAYLLDLRDQVPVEIGPGSAWDFSPAAPIGPVLLLSRGQVTFVDTPDGTFPAEQQVQVHDAGGGAPPMVTTSVGFEAAAGWLEIEQAASAQSTLLLNRVDPSGLPPGEHLASVEVVWDGADLSPQRYQVKLLVLEQRLPLRLNCGANLTPVEGWVADDYFVRDGRDTPAEMTVASAGVANAAPTDVYRSARESYQHSYLLPLPDGVYPLRLHLSAGTSNGQTIGILVEGQPAFAALDVAAAAGGVQRALVLEVEAAVSDGDGLLVETRGDALARISGLEVLVPVDNRPPLVDAGPDRVTTVGTTLWLDASAVDDGLPGGPLLVSWLQAAGPAVVVLDDPSAIDTGASFPMAGVYRLRLSADDGALQSTDDVEVTVEEQLQNTAPVVVAGDDLSTPEGTPVWLAGTVSDDGLPGEQLQLSWTAVAGPDPVQFDQPQAAQTLATLGAPGQYLLRLSASDGELDSSDEVAVTVTPAAVPSIELISPAGGERWLVGETQEIRWRTQDLTDITLRYSVDDGASWQLIATSVDSSMTSWEHYPWTIPDTPSVRCRVQVAGYFSEAEASSAAPFEIAAPARDEGTSGAVDAGPVETAAGGGCGCAGFPPVPSLGVLLFVLLARRREGHCVRATRKPRSS